jgi:hypothetical protein
VNDHREREIEAVDGVERERVPFEWAEDRPDVQW